MSTHLDVMITRSQAACVFYGQEITRENELVYEAKIDELNELELCYIDNNPTKLFLVPAKRINYLLFRYNTYRRPIQIPCVSTIDKEAIKVNSQVIHCQSQLKEFLDNVFLCVNPLNEKIYERCELSSEQVFQVTSQYTTIFEDKGLGTFTAVAKKIKAKYLKADLSRKRSEDGRITRKILYVMKPDDRAQNVNNYQYCYEQYIKSLKTDGFHVIGYVRKSPSKQPSDGLKETIKKTISCLQSRSQVTDIYVSPSSRSKSPIASRDMITDESYTDISGCVGNTQTLLNYLSSRSKKVCLVIVDYAALSTDPDDVLLLVKNYTSLEYIFVDRFNEVGKYEVYFRDDIIKSPEQLALFDCRPKLPHKSI